LLERIVLLPTANAVVATARCELQTLEFRLENAWREILSPSANLAVTTTHDTIRVFLALEKRRGVIEGNTVGYGEGVETCGRKLALGGVNDATSVACLDCCRVTQPGKKNARKTPVNKISETTVRETIANFIPTNNSSQLLTKLQPTTLQPLNSTNNLTNTK